MSSGDSFLERSLVRTVPTFESAWRALRGTYPPDGPPSADDFLGHLAVHVQQQLAVGRVAEVTRMFLAVERLLAEADPVLGALLEEKLIGRLAADCREARIAPGLVLPHLGPRSRIAWDRAGERDAS